MKKEIRVNERSYEEYRSKGASDKRNKAGLSGGLEDRISTNRMTSAVRSLGNWSMYSLAVG